jgi:hypothetical protein
MGSTHWSPLDRSRPEFRTNTRRNGAAAQRVSESFRALQSLRRSLSTECFSVLCLICFGAEFTDTEKFLKFSFPLSLAMTTMLTRTHVVA